MLYLANPSSPAIRVAMEAGELGMIATPAQGNSIPATTYWCADNGAFGKGYPGDEALMKWLAKRAQFASRCLFAVAPDVVADAAATLERSQPFFAPIRALGFPVALVGQDGLEDLEVPWSSFDAFFVGGSTEWKLSEHARALVAEAKRRGKWVHLGRVNSWRRLRYAMALGCDSVDGTFLTFGPDTNLPKLRAWLGEVKAQGMLFHAGNGAAS